MQSRKGSSQCFQYSAAGHCDAVCAAVVRGPQQCWVPRCAVLIRRAQMPGIPTSPPKLAQEASGIRQKVAAPCLDASQCP